MSNQSEVKDEKSSMPTQSEFISKVASNLGSSYLANLEAQNLWFYFKKCYEVKTDEEKKAARDKFFIALRHSLERMALCRELRR